MASLTKVTETRRKNRDAKLLKRRQKRFRLKLLKEKKAKT